MVLCTSAVHHVEAQRWLLDPMGVWVVFKPFTPDDVLTGITAALNNGVSPVPRTSETSSPNESTDHDPDQN